MTPIGFMSYAHFDDEHSHGRLTKLRALLSAEVRAQTGEDFPIFQDRADIRWGENWRDRIERSLDEASLLIPIITPSFFASAPCRDELRLFWNHEKQLEREDLILPIYYLTCAQLDAPDPPSTDDLIHLIRSRQYADWRQLRLKRTSSEAVLKAVGHLASQISATLQLLAPKRRSTITVPPRLGRPRVPPGVVAGVASDSADGASSSDGSPSGGSEFSFPVVQIGRVLRTTEPLSHEQCEAAVTALIENAETVVPYALCEDKTSVVRRDAAERALVSQVGGNPSLHFPRFFVDRGDLGLDTRLILTVCAKGTTSKIWARIGLEGYRNQPASALRSSEVSAFFEEGPNIARELAVAGAKAFEHQLWSRGAVGVDSSFEILIRVVNSSSNETLELFQEIRAGHYDSVQDVFAAPLNRELIQSWFKSILPESERAQSPSSFDSRTWQLHIAPDYGALYRLCVERGRVQYTGVAGAANTDLGKRLSWSHRPSVESAQAVGNLAANYY